MDGFKRQAVLLALLEAMKEHGSWCGETHVQKCVYFLETGIGVPLDVAFVLYKHGPFSFELRETLGEMRGNFLIDLEYRQPFGASLVVTEFGAALKQRFPRTLQRYGRQIDFVATKLSPRGVIELERLGTALYVRRQQPELSIENQANEITMLKPHIQPDDARKAVSEISILLAEAGAVPTTGVMSAD